LIVIVWSMVIVTVSLLHAHWNKKLALNSALIEAKTLMKQEELSRFWIAENGGLYIVSPESATVSALDSSQVGSSRFEKKEQFSSVSHIDISRQIFQKIEADYGYRAKMVCFDSSRAERVPDLWETEALQRLDSDNDSFYEVTSVDGRDSLRMVHVMRFKDECATCHQGDYRSGDMFGGFSLTIPLDSYYTALGPYSYSVLVGYLLLWSIGLVFALFAVRLFKRQHIQSNAHKTRLQLAETSLHYISYFDPGTNLPNRATFDDRLRVALAHAVRVEKMVAVAVVNIENFSKIKGLYSQDIGDHLIRKIAEVVAREIRPDDTIARSGNDRLMLLLPGLISRENVARVINKINQAFEKAIELEETEIFVKISFGVAVFPDDSSDPELIISYAETAAFRVTQQKLSTLQMYSEELNASANAHLQLETGLRYGLSRDEFCLFYQAQIDAPTGKIIGAEALIRWNHPTRGQIPPDLFISLAENNGTILPIGEWVLFNACRQAVLWKSRFQMPFRIGVNISARQFQDTELVDLIDRIFLETGIDPADLEIEITEGTIMEDVDRAVETLIDLKVRGIKVAIDDFGTGYSSLSQLKKMPFDRLKIDRSFVSDLDNDRDSQVIVEMIIELAAKLNMEIIAEGVETEKQKKFLISRGCYPMQGFLFAKPMPADEFTRLLESSKL